MPDHQRPEMLLPVSDEGAALQFFIEAMKANTGTLQQVCKTMQGMQDEQKETLRLVHDTRERVIKIESNTVNQEVAELKRKVGSLEANDLRQEGARNLATGTLRNGPVLLSALMGLIIIIVVLIANGKIG